MQNAVDAVRERRALCATRPDLAPVPQDTEGDVVISVDVDAAGVPVSVTVTDSGLGMTAATVRDFFLTAGASFRDSPEWRRAFTADDNRATVPRIGRFGIGALVAFLIGDTIEVTTRHVEATQGLRFTTTLDEDMIELRRLAADVPVGTTVVVRGLKDVEEIAGWLGDRWHSRLGWDFFCEAWPRVVRKGGGRVLPQRYVLPEGPAWWSVHHPDFASIAVRFWRQEGLLACNGIVSRLGYQLLPAPDDLLRRSYLDVAVCDPQGRMPWTLRRDRFTEELPFLE